NYHRSAQGPDCWRRILGPAGLEPDHLHLRGISAGVPVPRRVDQASSPAYRRLGPVGADCGTIPGPLCGRTGGHLAASHAGLRPGLVQPGADASGRAEVAKGLAPAAPSAAGAPGAARPGPAGPPQPRVRLADLGRRSLADVPAYRL